MEVQPQAPNQIVTIGQVLRAQQNNGSIYVSINNGWELNELHNVQINTPLTNDLLAYESSSYGLWKNKSISSLGLNTTSSFNDYTQSTNTFTASISTSVGLLQTFSGSEYKTDSASFSSRINGIPTINTGSFATTGSNSFIGNQNISGSASIINFTDGGIQTLKLLPYISSSAFNGNRDTAIVARGGLAGFSGITQLPTSPVNIIFENSLRTGTSVSATSIISGSNNIVTGLRTTATNAADIIAENSFISVFPSTRTPAYAPVQFLNSSINGLVQITNNSVGLSASLAQGSYGFGIGVAGALQNSNIIGTVTLNPNSASIALIGVLNAGALTVTGNKVTPSYTSLNPSFFQINNSIIAGTVNIFDRASGSFNSGNTQFQRNLFGGTVTVTNASSSTTNAALQNTIVFGNNLFITGSDSSALNSGGSAFFGRYNIIDGVVNNTSNVVFAVGAGISGNTKTPLWIGTDTTVNVTGSLIITGSNLSINSDGAITASKLLVTDTGTTAIQYNLQSTGSVAGIYNTSYGKDNIKVYQYQGQPYAFNINLTSNQANAYTGSQFEYGLQVNGSNVTLPGGGGTYFSMVSGSTTGSAGDPGLDKKGLDYLGTAMILDMNADTSFRRAVYVDKGMFVSQSTGGGHPALIVDGTNAASGKGIIVTGSVSITNVMNLKAQDPLPTGVIGDLAVSGSSLYFYNGAWTLVV